MGRIGTAFKLFFKALFNRAFANKARETLLLPAPAEKPRAALEAPARPRPPVRSEALTLLAVLQREARLVDFLKESIGAYSDAQIGAAVRDVHRDAAAALERMFAIRPLRQQEENSAVDVPAGFDANQIRLTGNVSGEPPYSGKLRHHGWRDGERAGGDGYRPGRGGAIESGRKPGSGGSEAEDQEQRRGGQPVAQVPRFWAGWLCCLPRGDWTC